MCFLAILKINNPASAVAMAPPWDKGISTEATSRTRERTWVRMYPPLSEVKYVHDVINTTRWCFSTMPERNVKTASHLPSVILCYFISKFIAWHTHTHTHKHTHINIHFKRLRRLFYKLKHQQKELTGIPYLPEASAWPVCYKRWSNMV